MKLKSAVPLAVVQSETLDTGNGITAAIAKDKQRANDLLSGWVNKKSGDEVYVTRTGRNITI